MEKKAERKGIAGRKEQWLTYGQGAGVKKNANKRKEDSTRGGIEAWSARMKWKVRKGTVRGSLVLLTRDKRRRKVRGLKNRNSERYSQGLVDLANEIPD